MTRETFKVLEDANIASRINQGKEQECHKIYLKFCHGNSKKDDISFWKEETGKCESGRQNFNTEKWRKRIYQSLTAKKIWQQVGGETVCRGTTYCNCRQQQKEHGLGYSSPPRDNLCHSGQEYSSLNHKYLFAIGIIIIILFYLTELFI